MKFSKPETDVSFPKLEEKILKYWKDKAVFQKSISSRPAERLFSFYDGPPFATGLPHHGHLLAGTIKDVIPRYWTMRGYRVDRRFGWDCHGLPIEFEMEKQLNLKGRKDIETYGIDRFNEACRSVVLRYTQEWQRTVERMGRWIDFERDYKTMDPKFMESVWSVFKKLWDKNLVYEDKKVLPYSTRITTPLSNFEAGLEYTDVQDPSVTVKFELVHQPKTFFLVWTTTPWTLLANLAVAANPKLKYVAVLDQNKNETYVVQEDRLAAYFDMKSGAFEIKKYYRGDELCGAGFAYKPLFNFYSGTKSGSHFTCLKGDFVTNDTGTGLVHMAPAFGEDDFTLCKSVGIEPFDHLDDEGVITSVCPQFQGAYFKDADKLILQDLKSRGLLFKQETIQHSYPFCYRSHTPLIYRAISTWFVRVTAIKEALLKNNSQIHWVPEHLKDGRFGKWLEGARDWAISRNRFWGNPLPIWANEETGEKICLGSIKELEELSGKKVSDIHKHFIDSITIPSKKHKGTMLKRIPHILDCWFESGAMPYAQNHYPFSMNEKEFSKIFPADFIAEGLDQTRGWFYTLLVLSTALDKGPPFKNVVVNGIVLAEDGRKMSKSLKNYPDPAYLFDQYGADALRIYLLASGAVHGEELRFSEAGVKEMIRKVLLPLWNAYSFLSTYAQVDGWDPETSLTDKREHPLDIWVEAKLIHLKNHIEREMEAFHLARTVPPVLEFLDDLTNWYIRRSRRRFWKSESDQDKLQAYSCLYTVLLDFIKIIAPLTPFIAEELYQHLRLHPKLAEAESVHLCAYPTGKKLSAAQESQLAAMSIAQQSVFLGRELREKLKIKIRQPLRSLVIGLVDPKCEADARELSDIIKDELNVKEIKFMPFKDMAGWSVKPNFRTLGQRLGPKLKDFQAQLSRLTEQDVFSLAAGGSVSLMSESFGPDCFLIQLQPKDGFKFPTHSSGSLVVALDTTMDQGLTDEGLARELINRVQKARKDLNFNVDDRIHLVVAGAPEVMQAAKNFQKLIEAETLSVLSLTNPDESASPIKDSLNDYSVVFAIVKK